MKEDNVKEAMKDEIISDYKHELTTPTILIQLNNKNEYLHNRNNIIEVSLSSIEKGAK